MPSIGWLEILIIVSIAIIVVGPKDFPFMLKKIGSWIGSAKRYVRDVQGQVSDLTNETLTSTANFVASPDTIQPYLIKSECFCFIEQTLNSGEIKIFTMVFFIDPSMDSDKNFNDLKELVFTYEFSEYKS